MTEPGPRSRGTDRPVSGVPGVAPVDIFAAELSIAGQLAIDATPSADVWRHPIETVAKSERGLDRTRQGESLTFRWPARLGEASLQVRPV